MKNKLITKIVIVAVCVSTLLITFVVPSFAYTINNPTTNYNSTGVNFQLPRTDLILCNYDNSVVDVPTYLYVPTSDNYGRDSVVCGSFVSNIGNNQGVSWSSLKTIHQNNVYENNGYVQNATTVIYSTAYNIDFTFYDFYGLRFSDYWINSDNYNNYSGIYNSFSFSCYNPDLPILPNLTYILPLDYYYSYYDSNGEYHEAEFTTFVVPDSIDGDMFTFRIDYFPHTINNLVGSEPSPVNDIFYLKDLLIYLTDSTIDVNFMHRDDDMQREQRSVGDYINRIKYPSFYDLDNLTDLLNSSYNSGVTSGRDIGYDEGYDEGIDVGFDLGYVEGSLNPATPFDSILSAVDNFLDWEFIPGISVGVILSIIIGVSLLITFLKVFAGG